jgi:hypothetical protein
MTVEQDARTRRPLTQVVSEIAWKKNSGKEVYQ